MSKDLLFTGVCSLALVPFADELDDDLIVDIVKDGSAFGVKGRTHKNLMATPAEYGLINWMITRLPLIGITVKGGDTFYIRQSLITPAEQASFAPPPPATSNIVPTNNIVSRLASMIGIEDDDETVCKPDSEPVTEPTMALDPNMATEVPSEECGTSGDVVMEAAEYSMSP